MKALSKKRLPELLAIWSSEYEVLVPARSNETSLFMPWQPGCEIELNSNTVLPPKDIFFPQTEKMYTFTARGQELEISAVAGQSQPRLLCGIRSCDVRSIRCLDQVFLSNEYPDEFYQQKRSQTLIVALSCTAPADTCFCRSMGINPLEEEGADLQICDLGEYWGLQSRTEEGEKLMQMAAAHLEEIDQLPLAAAPQDLQVDIAGISAKLSQLFEHPFWAEVSEKCLGCGICSYLCPTCHCFDIAGSVKGEQGQQYRCWDCCMFSEYTRMAGGHNPRPSKKERVRNRFLHKLQYFQERHGILLCTGCGRCLAHCPVGMDITAVIDRVQEVEVNE